MAGKAGKFSGVILAAIVVAILGCSPEEKGRSEQQTNRESSDMNSNNTRPEDSVVALCQLADEAYFEFGKDTEDRLLDALIMMDGFEGTVIGAPGAIDLEARERLPVLWARRASGLRSWQVAVLRNSTFVLSDLTRGRMSLHYAFRGPKRINMSDVPRSGVGDQPDRDRAGSAAASAEMCDLRSIANLPWESGTIAITLLIYDWVSNTVVTTLTHPAQPSGDELERALRIPWRDALDLETKCRETAKAPLPRLLFGHTAETPELKEPGVALKVPEKFPVADTSWPVFGAAKLSLTAGNIVEPLSGDDADRIPPEAQDGDVQIPEAVVHLMLVVVQLDETTPQVIFIDVPVHSEAPLKVGDVVDVGFTFDIRGEFGRSIPPSSLLYLVGGEYVSGPCHLVVEAS